MVWVYSFTSAQIDPLVHIHLQSNNCSTPFLPQLSTN
uniref:Uncharacterized protein n=1 Tax=Anguilla anguilla TaxID=7936 RepID=A0A0E9PYE7_ANGAN